MYIMLWKPDSYVGNPELPQTRPVDRARNMLALEPPIAEFSKYFFTAMRKSYDRQHTIDVPVDNGILAMQRLVSLMCTQLGIRDMQSFGPEQSTLANRHMYGHSADDEISAIRMVGDGLSAYRFVHLLSLYKLGAIDVASFSFSASDESVTIEETAVMFRSDWFIELSRDLAGFHNAYLRTAESGTTSTHLLNRAVELEELCGHILTENGAVRLSEDGRGFIRELRHEHNRKVRKKNNLLSGYAATSSGCPVRHRQFGAQAIIGTAHIEDISSWQNAGIAHIEGERVVVDYDVMREGSLFLADMLEKAIVLPPSDEVGNF